MPQYYTDFSEYTTGQQPNDWTEYGVPGSWTIQNDATGNHLISSDPPDQKSILTWDGKSAIDLEVTALKTMVEFTSISYNLVARFDPDTVSFFSIQENIFGDEIGYNYYIDGSFNPGPESSKTINDQGLYWQRFRINGTDVSGKTWVQGSSEPSSWDFIDTNYFITAPGHVGIEMDTENAVPIYEIGVGTGGDTAPMSPLGTPNPPNAPSGLGATFTS